MHFYVYKTTNLVNSKFYYGVHKSKTEFDVHYFGSGKLLKRAIAKYGKENFVVEVIKRFGTLEEAFNYEKEIITTELVASKSCYNVNIGGRGGSAIGRVYNKGRTLLPKTPEHKAKISSSLAGKSYITEAERKRLSEAGKGNQHAVGMTYVHTPEAKAAMRAYRLGMTYSDETKSKMSENRKGICTGKKNAMSNPIHRAKVAASKIGIKGLRHPTLPPRRVLPGSGAWNALIELGYK